MAAVGDQGFPFMPIFTIPPNLFATVGKNIVRSEVAVFGRVPFCSKLGIYSR